MNRELEEKLKAFFPESELEWRVQSCGIKAKYGEETKEEPWALVLCYIQARAIQNRLDDVIGFENWKDEYRVEGKDIICRLSLKIDGEWVAKENGATETDIEAFKGGISGAFKRVASSGFGIGRYLYELDNTFAVCAMKKSKGWNTAKTKDNKYIYWETPDMLPKFLPKKVIEPKKPFLNTDGTVNRKELVERVITPHVKDEMEKANTDSFNRLRNALYDTSSIEELEKVKMDMEYRKDWNRLIKYKNEDFVSLTEVYEEQRTALTNV